MPRMNTGFQARSYKHLVPQLRKMMRLQADGLRDERVKSDLLVFKAGRRPTSTLVELAQRDLPFPTILEVNSPELKSTLRKGLGHIDQHYLSDPIIGIVDVAQAGFGPEVVDREQKHHVIGKLHGMAQKVADLAPRRIGNDPINRLIPIKEVATTFYFRPLDGSSGKL